VVVNAGGQTGAQNICLREIEAYNASAVGGTSGLSTGTLPSAVASVGIPANTVFPDRRTSPSRPTSCPRTAWRLPQCSILRMEHLLARIRLRAALLYLERRGAGQYTLTVRPRTQMGMSLHHRP